MFKMKMFVLAMSATAICNTFIGFGGLETLGMSHKEIREYKESGANPVVRLAIADNGDGTYSWIRFEDR